ncbi:MAG TPA: hypothetical protein VGQ06_16615 [Gemmatimonadales bacterium]|jgi:hypothetical protein|nr:hypothetical protein [Gemmatimonadales bacterium]
MGVVFHVIAGAGVAHAAATKHGLARPRVGLLILGCIAGLLTHGVLDGLKHGYPMPATIDIVAGAALATAWCIAVRPPVRLLFGVVIAGALLPDVVDHTPAMLRWKAGVRVPLNPLGPMFPWHWPEGSGSMTSGARDPERNLDLGRNRRVSFANHAIVLLLSAGCVLASPWAFRWSRESSRG